MHELILLPYTIMAYQYMQFDRHSGQEQREDILTTSYIDFAPKPKSFGIARVVG